MTLPPNTIDPRLEAILTRPEMRPGADDLADNMAQMYYLVKDDYVITMLKQDPRTSKLLVALSHLVRTTKKTNKQIRIAKLYCENSCRIALLCQKKPNLVYLALFNCLIIYGNSCFDDTAKGWRGMLVTNKMRTIRIEGGQKRSGWNILRRG